MSSAREGNPHYNPGNLLNTLQRVFNVRNDRQLAIRLDVAPPLLCKIRGGKLDAPPWLLIHLHEETNFTIQELRALMGDHRPHSGLSARHPTRAELSASRTVRVEHVQRPAFLAIAA
jgi:antitoxin HigA-1